MKNYYFDLYLKIKLSEDVEWKNLNEYLSKRINKLLLKDNSLKSEHEKNKLKGYVISALHPIEKDKIYKKNKEYILNINSCDFNFCENLKECTRGESDILQCSIRMHDFRKIDELTTTTPCVTTIPNEMSDNGKSKYWTTDDSMSYLYESIFKNTKRKAIELFNIDKNSLENAENFINSIEIRNDKNIITNYKNGKIFSYSVDIKVKQDKISQMLANICIATGIAEKNSLGYGFCINKKERTL